MFDQLLVGAIIGFGIVALFMSVLRFCQIPKAIKWYGRANDLVIAGIGWSLLTLVTVLVLLAIWINPGSSIFNQ